MLLENSSDALVVNSHCSPNAFLFYLVSEQVGRYQICWILRADPLLICHKQQSVQCQD